jgi:hypothetical protein
VGWSGEGVIVVPPLGVIDEASVTSPAKKPICPSEELPERANTSARIADFCRRGGPCSRHGDRRPGKIGCG